MAIQVRYLRKQSIEFNATKLLSEYVAQFGVVKQPPIPIEEILENHLNLVLEFDDLQERLGFADVLGGLWASDRLVAIDESLDPFEHPNNEGRYRFTLSHEIGHWEQHRHYCMPDPDQPSLFDTAPAVPAVVCRTSQAKDPIEWQADYFAACLLMPRDMVYAAWESKRGNLVPFVHDKKAHQMLREMGFSEPDDVLTNMALELVAEDFAPLFRVSGQAMRIRLEELRLLRREEVPMLSM